MKLALVSGVRSNEWPWRLLALGKVAAVCAQFHTLDLGRGENMGVVIQGHRERGRWPCWRCPGHFEQLLSLTRWIFAPLEDHSMSTGRTLGQGWESQVWLPSWSLTSRRLNKPGPSLTLHTTCYCASVAMKLMSVLGPLWTYRQARH